MQSEQEKSAKSELFQYHAANSVRIAYRIQEKNICYENILARQSFP
jgi:hypothetical protein